MMSIVESNTDRFKVSHREALVKTLEDLGGEIAADIRTEIGEDYPPSSTPGNPPHRRTGLLQTGVANQTEQYETGVREIIYSNRAGGDPLVPLYLENGTQGPRKFAVRLGRRVEVEPKSRSSGMAARPFFTPAKEKWEPVLQEEIPVGLKGNLGF